MVRSYPCPGCGAIMVFDAQTQKMKCEYCETTCTIEELEEISRYSQSRGDQISGSFDMNQRRGDFKVFHCSACGAELLTDEHTSATFCSFCGQPTMIEERLSGQVMPSVVIPFKIGEQEAKNMFRRWAKKGIFTPKEFVSESTVQKVTGIYVPFWLYDYGARMEYAANCTKVRTETKGKYEYTYTEHYYVTREVVADYDRVPCDASEKMPDRTMDELEPFDYCDLTKFEMPYLSGYYSEKFNYSADDMTPRIEARVAQYIKDTTMSTIRGYSSITEKSASRYLQRKHAEYALLPVWLLNYRYKGKDYMFTLNGQTGKIVAKRPVSLMRQLAMVGALTLAFFAMGIIGSIL